MANSVDGMGTEIEEPAGPAWHLEHGGKCGVTATAEERKIVVSWRQELGAEQGRGASGCTL